MSTDLWTTPDLNLRAFEPDDAAALQAYLNHPDLIGLRAIPWRFPQELPLNRRHAEGIIDAWQSAENAVHFAIIHNTVLVGHAEFDYGWDPHCPGVSIVIAPDFRRRGFGSQVMRLLLRYAFEFTVAHNVATDTFDWNNAGIAFIQAHGFTPAGRIRHAALRFGQPVDLLTFDQLRPEWQASQ